MSTTRQLYVQRPVYYKCLRILVFHMMIYRTLVLAILKTVFLNMAIFVAIFIKSAPLFQSKTRIRKVNDFWEWNEVDTICFKKRISKKFKAIESSSYKQEFRYNPSYIRLLPNTQYVIRHNGMGAKVNIIKYFYTDSSGNLHYKCDEKSSRK